MTKFKLAIALSALGVAAASQAVTFNFQSNGTSALSGTTVTVDNPNLTRYSIGSTPGYTFVDLTYVYGAAFAPSSLTGTVAGTGTLSLRNSSNALGQFTFSFSGDATRGTADAAANSLFNLSFSQLAITLLPSATTPGFAAGLVGSGNFSGNKSGDTGGLSTTSFVSTFNPVPEPASLGVLAVGALALIRRRRNA